MQILMLHHESGFLVSERYKLCPQHRSALREVQGRVLYRPFLRGRGVAFGNDLRDPGESDRLHDRRRRKARDQLVRLQPEVLV